MKHDHGYAPVSANDQTLGPRKVAGALHILSDKISGSLRKRPELNRGLDQFHNGMSLSSQSRIRDGAICQKLRNCLG
ncbi:MAG: hypothetical protein JWS11_1922 [Cypionkella sp.]|nr:hypothetical protein [Cypionkella sp.]